MISSYIGVSVLHFIDDQESWKALREESEFSTDEEFIAELADQNNSLSMERSSPGIIPECVQV